MKKVVWGFNLDLGTVGIPMMRKGLLVGVSGV
eukprot:UN07194